MSVSKGEVRFRVDCWVHSVRGERPQMRRLKSRWYESFQRAEDAGAKINVRWGAIYGAKIIDSNGEEREFDSKRAEEKLRKEKRL